MNDRMRNWITALLLAAIVVSQGPPVASAASREELQSDAAHALKQLYASEPAAKLLGSKARGILVFPNIIKAGFTDAWAATQSGPGWTGMTSRKAPRGGVYCGEQSNGTPYKRIDYVLTKGLKPVATELFAFTGAGTPHPSDHLGLKATLELPPAR